MLTSEQCHELADYAIIAHNVGLTTAVVRDEPQPITDFTEFGALTPIMLKMLKSATMGNLHTVRICARDDALLDRTNTTAILYWGERNRANV